MRETVKYLSLLVILVIGATLVACNDHNIDVTIHVPEGNGGSGTPSGGSGSQPGGGSGTQSKTVTLKSGPQLETKAQKAIKGAKPGTTIVFPAGTFKFTQILTVRNPGITLKGQGQEKTILDFSGQRVGKASLDIQTDKVVVKDLAVVNSPADYAIRAHGSPDDLADQFTFNHVRTSWDKAPNVNDGAYGFYTVETQNVLIENSTCIGSTDACIYVGQSKNIVIRNNNVTLSVIGIELESSAHADVYGNTTTKNAGGMVLYDLPSLPVEFKSNDFRVYNNKIFKNNTPNFTKPSGFASDVPTGSGILVLSNNHDHIFNNEIHDNQAVNVGLISFKLVESDLPDKFSPYVQAILLSGNTIYGGGNKPVSPKANKNSQQFGQVLKNLADDHVPDFIWTRQIASDAQDPNDASLNKPSLKICFHDNKGQSGDPLTYNDLMRIGQGLKAVNAPSKFHDCDGSKLGLRTKPLSLPQMSNQEGQG